MSEQSQASLGSLPRFSAAQGVSTPSQVQRFSLVPGKVTRLLLGITAILVGIHVLTQLAIVAYSDFTGRDWLTIMFGLGVEANLPTAFSSGLLLFSGLLLGTVALQKRRSGAPFAFQWALLSAVFLFLGLDEVASIHDNISKPLNRLYKTEGALMYVWVVPYGLAVAFLFLSLLKFLFQLPAATRRLFLLAGFLYVGAAMGIEIIQAFTNSQGSNISPLAFMSVTVEEGTEMIGMVVFIYALLSYIQKSLPGFALQLDVSSAPGQERTP
jgi:hypothetical protein